MEKDNATVIGRMIMKGTLVLDSPLLIGDGTGDESIANTRDIHVLKNSKQQPIIPGTSLAGVLRDCMLSSNDKVAMMIFGNANKENSEQSLLQVEDVVLRNAQIISRDGVRIDPYTGTAVDGAKFDYEVVDRGAEGELTISLTLRRVRENDIKSIRNAFISIRNRLENGIAVGGKTATGFGRVRLIDTKSRYYDFTQKEDVISWLFKSDDILYTVDDKSIDILENGEQDQNANTGRAKDTLVVDADFVIRSAMLIREYNVSSSYEGRNVTAVFKCSGNDFVIPGTSLKGVLRHHAEYVLERLNFKDSCIATYINDVMGHSISDDSKSKSRLYVDEVYINRDDVKKYSQARTKIDRITGGVVRSALFSTEPIWQIDPKKASIHIHFEIKKASAEDVGLALIILRDMWLGNVPIGGEKSIGRGTLQGLSAKIHYIDEYVLDENGRVTQGDPSELQAYVQALVEYAELLELMEEER